MRTIVTKGKCVHTCKSEEQLQRFLAAGWKKARKQPNQGEGAKTEQPETEQGKE